MALTGKYVSFKTIVERVFIDCGYTIELDSVEVAEWVGSAMNLIGAPRQNIRKTVCIDIEDYRGDLPCDLLDITSGGVRDWTTKVPYIYASATHHNALPLNDTATSTSTTSDNNFSTDTTVIGDDDPTTGIFNIDENGYPILPDDIDYIGKAQMFVRYGDSNSNSLNSTPTYTMNNSKIMTSIKDGKVEMTYDAFPVDENGYPQVPDEEKYIQAIVAYIRMKIDYKLWRRGMIADKVFNHSEREWNWYAGAAYESAMTLSVDQMESLKNAWTRMIPRTNMHATSFEHLNLPEIRYTH